MCQAVFLAVRSEESGRSIFPFTEREKRRQDYRKTEEAKQEVL
jgi:hypothetical protein